MAGRIGRDSSAPDRTEALILDVARAERGVRGGDAVVVDDESGHLIAGALDLTGPGAVVRARSRSAGTASRLRERFAAELATGRLVLADAETSLAELVVGGAVRLALVRLPKALRALDATARALAAGSAGSALTVVAGGRVKHMTRSQNDVLAASFNQVRASRGSATSRCLIASSPRTGVAPERVEERAVTVPVRGRPRTLSLRGIGGVFGGPAADAGSLLLLRALDEALESEQARLPEDVDAVDLGCGNGLLTAYLALALPGARVIASDDDLDAVASTRATLAAQGTPAERVAVTWDHSLSRAAPASADLVLLNPPFHDGSAVDATLVHGLLDAAARVLRPDGELWLVHNSLLRYRPQAERRVGPVSQAARDRRFTVLRARRRGA